MGDTISDDTIRDLYRRANDAIDDCHDRDVIVSDRLLWALALIEASMSKRGIRP